MPSGGIWLLGALCFRGPGLGFLCLFGCLSVSNGFGRIKGTFWFLLIDEGDDDLEGLII